MWIFKTDTGTFKGEREKVWFRNENTDKVEMDWQGEINLAEDATPPPRNTLLLQGEPLDRVSMLYCSYTKWLKLANKNCAQG